MVKDEYENANNSATRTLTADNNVLTVAPSRDWKYSFWVV